jgi:hypothetical protein
MDPRPILISTGNLNRQSLAGQVVVVTGAGFAAAVALAPRFRGMEIGSIQALIAAEVDIPQTSQDDVNVSLSGEAKEQALSLCREVKSTLVKEHAGWKQR